jgi:hypothetical protein
MAPRILVSGYQRFEGISCLHVQGTFFPSPSQRATWLGKHTYTRETRPHGSTMLTVLASEHEGGFSPRELNV